jgi:DNA-binding transcriptional LysR family regulator
LFLIFRYEFLIAMADPNPAPALEGAFRKLRLKGPQVLLLNALAEHGSLHRAAAAIHTTQPAATGLLRQLEDALGVSLFLRHAKGMTPTTCGEVMIRYARGVLHDFERAREEMSALTAGHEGVLHVGSVMGAVPGLVAAALARYKESYPKVRVSLLVESSDILLPALLRGDLDVAVGRLPDGHSDEGLELHALQREPMSVVVGRTHPLRRKARVSVADLMQYTWVLHPEGSPMRHRIDQAVLASGATRLPDVLETASLLATTAMLERTTMISIIPAAAASHYAAYGIVQVLPLELPLSMAPLALITRTRRNPPPPLRAFCEMLESVPGPPQQNTARGRRRGAALVSSTARQRPRVN